MKISLTAIIAVYLFAVSHSYAENVTHTVQFSTENGKTVVRTDTPRITGLEAVEIPKRPVRNPSILAQVLWVDRAHEYAISENTAITPDGSRLFVGWWLNNERFSSYATAGLESPVWTYREEVDWQLPVDASNENFCGTATGLPVYIWNHDSPLYVDQVDFGAGYIGVGVSSSDDGDLLAAVAQLDYSNAILIVFDLSVGDTLFTRNFVPAFGLNGVDFSGDGSTIVVSNYEGLLVYDVPTGDLIDSLSNFSQNTARISGDGIRIVNGTFSGDLILYEWNGTQYDTAWTVVTGDDWVTAVDISKDGSTVGCGTLDFVGGGYGGKFMLMDADSGSVLIDYAEYGDEVSSVALSANGQYAIAGSWGQYNGTYGDVITCFIRDTNVPIFQLLDDVDEPGSVFSVAISDSGHYAAAGGKATHARAWGNGGMVYSIKIKDPADNDVAVASIDAPGEFVDPGETVIPTATFINVGTNSASFNVNCIITEIDSGMIVYYSSFDVYDLPSFATSVVNFSPDFTMPGEGRYEMTFNAVMANDEDQSNNDLSLLLRSWHDIRITEMISPFNEVTRGWPMTPAVLCKNLGSYTEDFEILAEVYDSITNMLVFSTQSSVFNLEPYMTEEIQFNEWNPDANGAYRVQFEAVVPDDRYPDDNTASLNFSVVDEMIYDDGVQDVNFWVDLYPYSINRKFGQKFEPNIPPPFNVTNVRFYVGSLAYTGYFDYIGITKESAGLPDTNDFLAYASNPQLSGPGAWTSMDFNAHIGDGRPLWVVLHWPDREDQGPYIGGDQTGILDGQSYWYDNDSDWNQYPFADWMIRMTLEESATGVETEYITGLPRKLALRQNYPNPFNPNTNIRFELPNPGKVNLQIFSITGAKVKTLADSYFDAGYHTITWDGTSNSGEKVASGTYFYRLDTVQNRITRKMIMLK